MIDNLPAGFTVVGTGATSITWQKPSLNVGETWTQSFLAHVGENVPFGNHVNRVMASADNHGLVQASYTVQIVGLPVTGISIGQIALWMNLVLLLALVINEMISLVVTGQGVVLRGFRGIKLGEGIPVFRLAATSTFAVALLAVLVYPFTPMLFAQTLSEEVSGTSDSANATEQVVATSVPEGNYLVIPKIGVRIPIAEGNDESALSEGAWRLPGTSTPDAGGNTALAAHRFKYLPPHEETFYLLDKLQAGDEFTVYWQGKEYQYKVASSYKVQPDAIEVLAQTETPTITLITCAPLFSAKERLIVSAELVQVS
jgi:LPXTG-site transpeptidase (sortase) family protein